LGRILSSFAARRFSIGRRGKKWQPTTSNLRRKVLTFLDLFAYG
jgi:hypothetical protein